jgi:hypothetical protein
MKRSLCEFWGWVARYANRRAHDYRCKHGAWPGMTCLHCKWPERRDHCVHCGELPIHQRTTHPTPQAPKSEGQKD